jgi:MFS family permease
VDSVVPVYSAELSSDDERGKSLAQSFQANIFGLNMAFAINLALTVTLGKSNEWAWRIPIIAMQIYPLSLFLFIGSLPESPRWLVSHDKTDQAENALKKINFSGDDAANKREELVNAHKEESENPIGYTEMFTPGHIQFHPTIITIMGQVCQALTGYGAVSVYGPQIFEQLGYGTRLSEYLTMANFVSYFCLMYASTSRLL